MATRISTRHAGSAAKPRQWIGGGPRARRLAIACSLSCVALARPGVAEPIDPIRVFFPIHYCESGILEVEVWDRSRAVWEPHPEHRRILANQCQTEEAGRLYNETRFRCLVRGGGSDPSPSDWQRVLVFDPSWMERCAEPPRPSPKPFAVRLDSPRRGDVVANLTGRVDLHGWIDLDDRPVSGHDLVFVLDEAASVRDVARDLARSLLQQLQERPEAHRIGIVTFSSATTAHPAPAPGVGHTLRFDTNPARVARSLESSARAGPPQFFDALTALDFALAAIASPALEPGEGALPARRSIVAALDAAAPHPFGDAVEGEPVYRERFLALRSIARERHVGFHVVALAAGTDEVPEVARRFARDPTGSFYWSAGGTSRRELRERLAERVLPRVVGVEVQNLDIDAGTVDAELEAFGRFHASIALSVGRNRIAVRGVLSPDRRATGEFEVFFDPSGPRETWLKTERERIEAIRQRQQRKIITIDAE